MSKQKRKSILFHFFVSLLVQTVQGGGPQPCPENPIVLTGSDFVQFVYSPYDESKKYLPNTDCRFILVARTLQRRIHINIIESRLEEPLFTDCKDYISIRDGALPTSPEVLRWCGSVYPPAFSSSGDSFYVQFHSDNLIQSRGFNFSFVDYEIPGCPPDWISDSQSIYCYRLFDSVSGYTFTDAQKACFYERANLLTIENSDEYDFIYGEYSGSHTSPWIGYSDANKEGIFDPIDPNVKPWPEKFPVFKSEHSDKDCIFLDWNIKDGVAYTIDDCRNRRSLICKTRRDGKTIPVQLPNTLIRYGFQESSFNYLLFLIILIVLIIVLIILWIIYQKCKRANTVEATNTNQQLPIVAENDYRREPATASNNARSKNKSNKTKTSENVRGGRTINEENRRDSLHDYGGSNNPKIHTKPNQPIPIDSTQDSLPRSQLPLDEMRKHEGSERSQQKEVETITPISKQLGDRSHLYHDQTVQAIKAVSSKSPPPLNGNAAPLHSILAPVGEPNVHRETTNVTTGLSSTRSRTTQTFERPNVGPLDNVSALSLDEFWQRN